MRQIGSNTKYPTGASPGSFGGDDPGIAKQDHIHSLWSVWEELELSTGWIPNSGTLLPDLAPYRDLSVAKAGNLVEVNGIIEFDGDATTTTAPQVITTLPEIYRPNVDIICSCYCIIPAPFIIIAPTFLPVQISTNGQLEYLDPLTTTLSPAYIYVIIFNNFLYRTDYVS